MASRIKGITVEIGGDTTKLSTALKDVNSEIRQTQSQLKDVDKLLKLDPKNTELLTQKQQLLGNAVEGTKTKLETLKTAANQANEQLAKGDITREQYDALKREIVETTQTLQSLEEQAHDTNATLSGVQTATDKLGDFSNASITAGKKLLPLTATITAASGASAKMAMDFEDAMAKVSTIADTTQIPLADLEDAILNLSNETGIAATDIAQNVYDAISSGQQTGDAVNFVSNSTKLAKAGFADAISALDILTTIMNAYGLEASEVSAVSDTLIQTQDIGKTTVAELSSSMGKLIPTAKANSVALDQIATGYAILTSNGIATAESTTYMNSMLNELGKSGTKVAETLQSQTGKSFSKLMAEGYSLSDVLQLVNDSAEAQGLAFTDLWGSSEAGKAGLVLLGDSANNFNSTLEQMRTATGATDEGFDKLQTNSNAINISLNRLKNVAIDFGTALMNVLAPIIVMLADSIATLTNWFSNLSDGTKTVIVIIAGVLAVVGPLLIVVGKIATGVGAIINLVGIVGPVIAGLIPVIVGVGAPILAVVATIIAVIAAGKLLINHWDEIKVACEIIWNQIKDFFINIWEHIKNIFQVIVEVIKSIVITYFNYYKTFIEIVLNGIKTVFSGIWEGIKVVFSTIVETIKTILISYFNTYKTIIQTVLNTIKVIVETIWNTISFLITAIITSIKNVITIGWNGVKAVITTVMNTINTVISTIWNVISTTINTIVSGIKDTISRIWSAIESIIKTIINRISYIISTVFSNIWGGIANAMGNIYNTIKGGFESVTSYITGLASSAYTWGVDIIDGMVKGIRNSIGKIADAVKSVAATITSFLHFSVPDEGPLTEYETWMPDFMSGLAKGIEQSKGLVTRAVEGVAQDMVINPSTISMRTQSAQMASLDNLNKTMNRMRENTLPVSQSSAVSDIVIPVYLGGTMIDEIVVNAQTRQNLRSGGR